MSEYAPLYPGSVAEQQSATVPQTESSESATELADASQRRLTQIPSVPDVWKRLFITRDTFALANASANWSSVYRLRFIIASSIAQDIYFDDIRMLSANQDDALGARYKYAYESSATQHHGNLNALASVAIKGEHNPILVTGFKEPPDSQGIDTLRIYRDVGADGNYQSVGTIAIPPAGAAGVTFVDTVGVSQLGDLDTNDNAPPPAAATVVAKHMGSMWLNDLSNPRRVWRTPPGRFESFSIQAQSGFFDIGEVGDRVITMGVVNGQFFIWTLRAIYMVMNPQATPVFRKIVDVGTVNQYAHCVVNDLAVFVYWDGIYTFDGAQLRQLPKIGAIFDANSMDERRVVEATISDILLGSDGKYVWLTFKHYSSGVLQTFVFDHITKAWTEESQRLCAHEQTNTQFSHIFGNQDSQILTAFGSSEAFAPFDYESNDVELPGISFLSAIAVDIGHQLADATLRVFVDNSEASEFFVPSGDNRRWEMFPLPDNIIGEYCRMKLTSEDGLELYNAYTQHKVITDTVSLDSGPIAIAHGMSRAATLSVDTKVLGLSYGEISVSLQIDNVVVNVGMLPTAKGEISILQQTVEHVTGSVLRIRAKGVRFAPISLVVGLSVMGTKEPEYVAIPLNP